MRQFWLLSHWQGPKQERFTGAQRTFHHLERFRKTYGVERQSEHLHHLLCLNCHPLAPGLYWGKMPFKKINHQHKLRKSEPLGQLCLVFQQERRRSITTGLVCNCLPPAPTFSVKLVWTCWLPETESNSEFKCLWDKALYVLYLLLLSLMFLIFILHLLSFSMRDLMYVDAWLHWQAIRTHQVKSGGRLDKQVQIFASLFTWLYFELSGYIALPSINIYIEVFIGTGPHRMWLKL